MYLFTFYLSLCLVLFIIYNKKILDFFLFTAFDACCQSEDPTECEGRRRRMGSGETGGETEGRWGEGGVEGGEGEVGDWACAENSLFLAVAPRDGGESVAADSGGNFSHKSLGNTLLLFRYYIVILDLDFMLVSFGGILDQRNARWD